MKRRNPKPMPKTPITLKHGKLSYRKYTATSQEPSRPHVHCMAYFNLPERIELEIATCSVPLHPMGGYYVRGGRGCKARIPVDYRNHNQHMVALVPTAPFISDHAQPLRFETGDLFMSELADAANVKIDWNSGTTDTYAFQFAEGLIYVEVLAGLHGLPLTIKHKVKGKETLLPMADLDAHVRQKVKAWQRKLKGWDQAREARPARRSLPVAVGEPLAALSSEVPYITTGDMRPVPGGTTVAECEAAARAAGPVALMLLDAAQVPELADFTAGLYARNTPESKVAAMIVVAPSVAHGLVSGEVEP